MIWIIFLVCLPVSSPHPVSDDCKGTACKISLVNHMKAALYADLDTSQLTSSLTEMVQLEINNRTNEIKEQIQTLVKHEMKNNVNEEIIRQTQNMVAELKEELKSNVDEIKKQTESMMTELKQDFGTEPDEIFELRKRTVAVTAKLQSSTTYYANTIIKFDDFTTSIGLTDTAAFTFTGKFTCTSSGIYLVSFTLMSRTDDAFFKIYQNDKRINLLFVGDTSRYHEATGVFVLDLQTGDTVYVKNGKEQHVVKWSMVTIVKIN